MRKICVFTGTRADYGLLRKLILAINSSRDASLQLIVSGTHLISEHGLTEAELVDDGLSEAARVPIWSGDDDPLSVAVDTGRALAEFATTLNDLAPDVVVVLGDRLEAFAVAAAATVLGVPVAHVHGGELTEGAMDDSLRHAITKLAFLHFVTTEEHRRRVIQLGESPERVFALGAPIVDAVADLEVLPQSELARQFGVRFGSRTALMTFHPAAMDVRPADELLTELLAALHDTDDLHIIITGTNSDIGSHEVRRRIASFVAANADRADYVESFGQVAYLSAMSYVDVVVGNSSSTVLEAPVLGVPSVLIGDRQAGRPMAATVMHPDPDRASIARAIAQALAEEPAERTTARDGSPFGTPGFAERALDVLVRTEIERFPRKRFHDSEEVAR